MFECCGLLQGQDALSVEGEEPSFWQELRRVLRGDFSYPVTDKTSIAVHYDFKVCVSRVCVCVCVCA
jgi:hypothetical protein